MKALIHRFLATAALAALLAAPLAAQVTITTGTPTDGVTPLGKDASFGTIPTAIAQTFMTPGGTNVLQSFDLFISGGFGGGSTLLLDASVYAFDTDHLVGPALYSSGLFDGTDDPTDQLLQFGAGTPLDLSLNPGTVYAIVLSSVEGYAATPDGSTITVGASATDAYPDGDLFVSTDPADLFSAGSFSESGPPDAAFSATFTNGPVSTPEPPGAALMASGLIGVLAIARRRRAARA